MARGWESKAVEDQISEREAESAKVGPKRPDPRETERKSKLEGILLIRSRTLTALESAHDERYKALLNVTLAHLNSELEKL